MTGANDRNDLMKRLAQVWNRRRRLSHLRGFCHVLLWAIALLTVVFLIDWLAVPSGTGRLALLGANILILAAVGYWMWWRHLGSYDPVVGALEVERNHPELGGLLVTYVQFHDKGIVHEGASPTLVAAMLEQAEERTRTVSFRKIVRFGSIWKLYLLGLIACGATATAVAFFPDYARVFMVRLLNPFSNQRYPTRTVFDETSGDLVVQQGRPVLLRAVVSGVIPNEVVIRHKLADGAIDDIRVTTGEPVTGNSRVFTHEIGENYRSFDYTFLAGDAVSDTHKVRVVSAPAEEIRVRVNYPEYMDIMGQTVHAAGFEAPLGSTIEWRVAADRPLAGIRMILDEDKVEPVALSADKMSGIVKLSPVDSFTYGFEWTDEETGFAFSPEVRYAVRMTPDQSPTIALSNPVIEEKATIWKSVDLAFTARDDYGLASARVAYKVSRASDVADGGEELKEKILVFPKECLETTEALKWRVKDSIPDLEPGDVVTYAVEVLDRQPAPAGPGVGRSETCRIIIVSQEEFVRIAMEKRQQLLAKIQSLHDEEREADKAIESILEKRKAEEDQEAD